jgi:hypothetical protein
MRLSLEIFRRLTAVVFLAGALVMPLSAASYNFGTGLGTLSYTATEEKGARCIENNGRYFNYIIYSYYNFSYTSANGTITPISGGTSYTSGGAPSQGCPLIPPGPTITFNGNGYAIVIKPATNDVVSATITIPGYINPKYVVLSVVYAPPGSQSNVDYTNSKSVSNTSTITSTFMKGITNTVKVTLSGGLFAFLNGTQTGTSSTTVMQQSQDTKSVTASYTQTELLKVSGPGSSNNCSSSISPANDFVGLDHDCDHIEVWINPVLTLTMTNGLTVQSSTVQWDGYGYSALDPTAPIDVVDILVGCLNGDIPATDSRCASKFSQFERTWAANENWPSGEGPGLTQADINNILAADQWGQCRPNAPIGSSACPTYSTPGFVLLPPEFTISDLEDIPYSQGAAQTGWTVITTNSSMQGQESKSSYSQMYGIEETFSGSLFITAFSATLSTSNTLTWQYEQNNTTTVSGTFSGMANITGPACTGDPCNPPYPPSTQTYGTATEFDIFQDTFFGTFAFLPAFY